jgi:hypothetical protein
MIMHRITLCTPCVTLYDVVSYLNIFALDPVELEPKELQEQVPVEDTNPEQYQGKPRCI